MAHPLMQEGTASAGTVVSLPDGLPGFERCRRYVVVTSPSLDPFTCLQGLDDSQPSFLAVDPRSIEAGYDIDLSAADRARLGAHDRDPLLWLSLVSFDDHAAKVNLRAPVVINPHTMTGVQLIAAESPYPIEHAIPLE